MAVARTQAIVLTLLITIPLFCTTAIAAAESNEPGNPGTNEAEAANIHFWYGTSQIFGIPGLAQPWVNILGHLDAPAQPASMTYSLNKGPERPLRTGPDSRRLAAPGDFNIELNPRDLREGRNTIRVRTSRWEGESSDQALNLEFRPRSWPLPSTIDWSATRRVQDAVQIVDGLWRQTPLGVRTAPDRVGYDRSLAIGDRDWTGYEILVPLTVHAVDTSAYASPESVSPGFGLVLHWNGHSDTPVRCSQPHCGWLPAGAFHWYNFPRDRPSGLNISTNPIQDLSVAFPYELTMETTYLVRSRVEPMPFQTLYFLKIWKKGEKEPETWSLQRASDRKDPGHGGILLVAHHVDLTIGNIEVRQLATPWPWRLTDMSAFSRQIRQYQGLAPLALTLAAGLLFLVRVRIREKTGRRKAVFIVGCALPAATLCFLLEPYLSLLPRHLPLSAAMAAMLYIGFDFLSALFLALIWITLLLYTVRGDKREFTT